MRGNSIIDMNDHSDPRDPEHGAAPLFGVWPWEQNTETDYEEIVKQSAEYFRAKARERWGA